jgi:hypothetical protein
MAGLYKKKFDIGFEDAIVTAGSCFAQHVANGMRRSGYDIIDAEELPDWVPTDLAKEYGYGIYSARYGNIYTSRQLLQLIKDCKSGRVDARDVWEKDGRFYDALRPSVEPQGLESVEAVLAHRAYHLQRVRNMFDITDVLVFTLGLTETWQRLDGATVYPTCPGVIAGRFDPEIYGFVNLGFLQIYRDMLEVRKRLMAINPDIRFILTVSPVPLTATAAPEHVLVSTIRSKSILRAVCATLTDEFANVDYFPSYEIITSPATRSMFYEPNLRSINAFGVETVMKTFFGRHPPKVTEDDPALEHVEVPVDTPRKRGKNAGIGKKDEIVCEEALLEAFSK